MRVSVNVHSGIAAAILPHMRCMNRVFVAVALVLVTVAGVRDAQAQIMGRIQFTTAFPSTVGNTTLPGGTYSIASDSREPSLLVIQGWNRAGDLVIELGIEAALGRPGLVAAEPSVRAGQNLVDGA